ncbi:MAG: ABC transporter permease, partial [Paracoccaceae bacterium]
MLFQFEKRNAPSKPLIFATPFISIAVTVLLSSTMLLLQGKSLQTTFYAFFVEPFESTYAISEIFLKFGPLLLIAQALAIGFRAKIWNIGAEGQMIMGAILASSIPVYFTDSESILILPAMIILGALGGMAWAAIAAFLKVRFNANEILVTLMLSSVALQILYYLLLGPWKDPMGFNFPQTTMFQDAALFPPIIFGFRLNYSLIIPLLFTVFVWIYMERHFGGFQLVVGGLAPSAATYAGYSSSGAVWKSLLIAGFAAGIAGMSE